MKILYGIQLTGNGHITRSSQLIKSLIDEGADVDIITSGNNSQINIPFEIKKHFEGLSIYNNDRGGIDWYKTFKMANVKQFFKDIEYDVSGYDLVISDFEPISAWASKKSRVTSIGFGNQYSFLSSKLPRPYTKDKISETFLRRFAKCDYNIGLSYNKLDEFIYQPIINENLLNKECKDDNFYLIYLPSLSIDYITSQLDEFNEYKWKIYSNEYKENTNNIEYKKLNKENFIEDLINCSGIITASGFSTTSEALILNKKLWSIPLKGQYEQLCNAILLKSMGVLTDYFTPDSIDDWINNYNKIEYKWEDPTKNIIQKIIKIHEKS
jgi:uncharacterized protein (TIGR00661 family)